MTEFIIRIFNAIVIALITRRYNVLEQAHASRGQFLVGMKVGRIYDPLRAEPRFVTLLKEVHLDE